VFAVLTVFVMGYPCALGMATPLAMIRGGGLAAEHGILIRSGEAFQILKDVRRAVLDKTGTLTRGEPVVRDIVPAPGFEEQELLSLAAAAEAPSEHPFARAIVVAAKEQGLPLLEAAEFQAVPGQGVVAHLGGRTVVVGNLRFAAAHGADPGLYSRCVAEYQASGSTVVAVAVDGAFAGLITIADSLRPDAREAVAALRALGIEPIMITGDNEVTARTVAKAVGIDAFRAEVLPAGKAKEIARLQAAGQRVLMVGDGINDAPALTQADVGVAIGAGTDIAIESADVVLLGERLTAVADVICIGRASYRKTAQNIALAFAFNGVGVPLAVTGLVPPAWAMLAMVASVSAVLLNSFATGLRPTTQVVTRRLTFSVADMHCEACAEAIRRALTAVPGVLLVECDLASRTVGVPVAGATEASVLLALREAGFDAEPVAVEATRGA